MKRYLAAIALMAPLSAMAAPATGIPAEYYTTCRDAAEMAQNGESAEVADLIARLGNASVEKRGLKFNGRSNLDVRVVEGLDAQCRKDPEALLIHAVDAALRDLK